MARKDCVAAEDMPARYPDVATPNDARAVRSALPPRPVQSAVAAQRTLGQTIKEAAAATPEGQLRAAEDTGSGHHPGIQQRPGRLHDRRPQVGPRRKQRLRGSDQRGGDVAREEGGCQLDREAGRERSHVFGHHDAIQHLGRGRGDGFADGLGQP